MTETIAFQKCVGPYCDSPMPEYAPLMRPRRTHGDAATSRAPVPSANRRLPSLFGPGSLNAPRLPTQSIGAVSQTVVGRRLPPLTEAFAKRTTASVETAPPRRSVDERMGAARDGGEGLSGPLRSQFESRFGLDLSAVRVHTDGKAHRLATAFRARALTIGHHVFFKAGQFAPFTKSGQRLLAHELTHVAQQANGPLAIQRKADRAAPSTHPDPVATAKAVALEKEILGSPSYKKLQGDSKVRVREIIRLAGTKPLGDANGQRNYYLMKLKTALTTPFNGVSSGTAEYGCSADAEKSNRKAIEDALVEEKLWAGAFSDVDELIVASGKNKVARVGEGGKKFLVDRTDPKNIRVAMKVMLKGLPEEVGKVKQLEDAIERAVSMSTKGYFLDIEFVDKAGPDVFEFTVEFCQWPNSGNWAASPVTLSHEVHHALGLGDRYDYIESHANNDQMNVEMRLIWFLEQMKKDTGPRDAYSKMSDEANPLLAEDVCTVAFDAGAEREKCITARKDLDDPGIPAY